MKPFLQRHHRSLFYASWVLLALLQAAFTPLQDDEAYYWTFSRFLDWGYFDHPPMTALLIKIGYALLGGNLGVRLLVVVCSTITVYCCEQLTAHKNPVLFYALCAVLAALQVSAFMAVPDLPLLAFTALFFCVYRLFVQRPTWRNSLLLALVIAGLLYSKYHAALIVFFTLLSNPRLLLRRQAYLAAGAALLLYVPHLWWQYQHNWISFRYHLFESNVNPYKPQYTTDYLLGQFLIAGPLAGFILLPALFRYRPQDATERALKFTGVGILLFFLLSSFRGKVEANWTAPMVVPLLVLGHQYLLQRPVARRWTYRLVVPTLLLVLAIRVVMVADLVPAKAVRERFHQYHNWPAVLRAKTGGLPVALSSSYQMAAQYWYHSGTPTYSVNEYLRRRNNFNFWPLEDSMLGKPAVLFVTREAAQDSVRSPMGMLYFRTDPAFHSFGKVQLVPEKKAYRVTTEQPMMLQVTAFFPDHYAAYLRRHPEVDAPVKIGVFSGGNLLHDLPLHHSLQQLLKQPVQQFFVPVNLRKGKYFLRFAIGGSSGWYTHNSEKIGVEVR